MPELPEVETMRRGILGAVGGVIAGIEQPACDRKPILLAPRLASFRRNVVRQRIVDVGRLGKRVVVRLENGSAIIFEPRMTGLVLIADPPTHEHLRLRVRIRGARIRDIWYWDRRGLGSVRLLTPRQIAAHFGPAKLGPDALTIDAEVLRQRLGESRRAIKVAILDQRTVAGIGNLYASEILHLAQIHPNLECSKLTRSQWSRLQASIVEVLSEAIRYEGSTLSDGTYRNALNQAGGYQNHHRVYDRAGEACRSCGRGVVQRIVQAQRSTFFCNRCQPKKRHKMAVLSS